MISRLHLRLLFLLMIAVLVLVLLIPLNAMASTVSIIDQAHVLNVNQVRAEGEKLPNALFILTTATFTGDLDALNRDARQKLPNQQAIVIEIDTEHRNFSVQAGTSVNLSDEQASYAVRDFKSEFGKGGYTGATIAAIDSLQASLVTSTSQMTTAGKVVGGILLVVFSVVAVIMVRGYIKERRAWQAQPRSYSSSASSSYTRGSAYCNSTSSHHSFWSSGDSGGGSGGGHGGGAGGHF